MTELESRINEFKVLVTELRRFYEPTEDNLVPAQECAMGYSQAYYWRCKTLHADYGIRLKDNCKLEVLCAGPRKEEINYLNPIGSSLLSIAPEILRSVDDHETKEYKPIAQ